METVFTLQNIQNAQECFISRTDQLLYEQNNPDSPSQDRMIFRVNLQVLRNYRFFYYLLGFLDKYQKGHLFKGDFSPGTFNLMLDYVHGCAIYVTPNNILNLLQAANYYQINSLIDSLFESLLVRKKIYPRDVLIEICEWITNTENLYQEIVNQFEQILFDDFMSVISLPITFWEERLKTLVHFLQDDRINIPDEVEVLKLVEKLYAQADNFEFRTQVEQELIPLIRMCTLHEYPDLTKYRNEIIRDLKKFPLNASSVYHQLISELYHYTPSSVRNYSRRDVPRRSLIRLKLRKNLKPGFEWAYVFSNQEYVGVIFPLRKTRQICPETSWVGRPLILNPGLVKKYPHIILAQVAFGTIASREVRSNQPKRIMAHSPIYCNIDDFIKKDPKFTRLTILRPDKTGITSQSIPFYKLPTNMWIQLECD